MTFGAGAEVPAEPVVSLCMADGSEVRRPLRDVRARQVAAAVPWRAARSARVQSHYPGFYWSETTGSHVVYESRLELARLLAADFDPAVTAIAAQPLQLNDTSISFLTDADAAKAALTRTALLLRL